MGRVWPQTITDRKKPRRFQAKNPERSMVAARKPWDVPGLKLLQKQELLTKITCTSAQNDQERSHLVSRMWFNICVKT